MLTHAIQVKQFEAAKPAQVEKYHYEQHF
jgi:hypothetical protein